MKIKIVKVNNKEIALIESDEILIKDEQSALDLFATVEYETRSDRMIIEKSIVAEEFFDLSSKLAGKVLQKFINYRKKLAILGDFSVYESRSLRDFIYECNSGNDIFFLNSEEEAIKKLSEV